MLELLVQKVTGMEQKMVTKDDLNRTLTESQKDIIAMLQHIEKKIDSPKQEEQAEAIKALTEMYGHHELELTKLKTKIS